MPHIAAKYALLKIKTFASQERNFYTLYAVLNTYAAYQINKRKI